MNKELLQTKIIEKKREKSFNKFKAKAWTIHSLILVISYYLLSNIIPTIGDRNYHIQVMVFGLIISLLLIGSAYMIRAVYSNIPSKGEILFYNDYLLFVNGKNKVEIRLDDLSKFNFHVDNDQYSLEISNDGKVVVFQLDIIFQHEKEKLNEIIDCWKENSIEVNVLIGQKPTNHLIQQKNRTSNISFEYSKINFTKFKIRIIPSVPFYASSTIPFNFHTKKELHNLVKASFENLGWLITYEDNNNIHGITDAIIISIGDDIIVRFEDNCFVITSCNKGTNLFTIGSKQIISSLLEEMTNLSNDMKL
jgi:hypothetical protein